MLNSKGVNAVGELLDYTWGRGGDGQRACRGHMQGSTLTLKFSTVFYFSTHQSMADQTRRLSQESADCLKQKIAEVKKVYDAACDDTITTKLTSDGDDVELISSHANTPRRVAYYHRTMVFELS